MRRSKVGIVAVATAVALSLIGCAQSVINKEVQDDVNEQLGAIFFYRDRSATLAKESSTKLTGNSLANARTAYGELASRGATFYQQFLLGLEANSLTKETLRANGKAVGEKYVTFLQSVQGTAGGNDALSIGEQIVDAAFRIYEKIHKANEDDRKVELGRIEARVKANSFRSWDEIVK